MRGNAALLGPMACCFTSLEGLASALELAPDVTEGMVHCGVLPAPSYRVYMRVSAGRGSAREVHEFYNVAAVPFARMYVKPALEVSDEQAQVPLESRVYKAFQQAWDDYENMHALRLQVDELNLLLDQPEIFCRRSTFGHIVDGTLLRVLRSVSFNNLGRFIRVAQGLREHVAWMISEGSDSADLNHELHISALLSELDDLVVPKARLYLPNLSIWALQARAQKWIDEQQRLYQDGGYAPRYA